MTVWLAKPFGKLKLHIEGNGLAKSVSSACNNMI
jgi:hypothetical protein